MSQIVTFNNHPPIRIRRPDAIQSLAFAETSTRRYSVHEYVDGLGVSRFWVQITLLHHDGDPLAPPDHRYYCGGLDAVRRRLSEIATPEVYSMHFQYLIEPESIIDVDQLEAE